MFGIVRAPEFGRPGLTWFNVPEPLSLAAVAGRVTVLDFWTFCCINCVHVMPALRLLEEAFPREVTVIGVHSPKFRHERNADQLRHAIARYDIRHPVVHDPGMVLWREYGVRAWPTLVFLSPDGRVIGQVAGEPDPDRLLQGIGAMVEQFWERGQLRPDPMPLAIPDDPGGALRFPGKIKPCPPGPGEPDAAWAVADTGHHQIVLIGADGTELARYGCGQPGFVDGVGAAAAFDGPEGLACDADFIWVADTRNHAIRRIGRADGQVTTVAGTGWRGMALYRADPGIEVALASPWDVELGDGVLYFANAGTHQVGRLDLGDFTVRPLAGSGIENLSDGVGREAALAQPSGLALDREAGLLYVADSETSAVRRVRLGDDPRTETVVGTGLFDFGHVNGPLAEARLQHPLGLAVAEGRLYVADSFNSAVRRIDLAEGMVGDVAWGPCAETACRPLSEPAGVAVAGDGRLLVSDTNNHRIVEWHPATGTSRTWFA
jgi:thiol-disulfide isomerase/thioredoxin/DNA-binding beta-propeller fold protein YncE